MLGDAGPYDSAQASARAIAQAIADDQGGGDVIVVATTESGEPVRATVTVDVLGFEDDSLLGLRLIVASSASTGWEPASVIQATLCARGVSPDGLCV